MGYDRGDSFPFDSEPIGVPFGSKSKGKLSPRSYLIQYERKWKSIFLSVSLHKISIDATDSSERQTPITPQEGMIGVKIIVRSVFIQKSMDTF